MITKPLKRGEKCYWKNGDVYQLAYFQSLNPMPVAPHAVKIRLGNGSEAIARDFEVMTPKEKFCDVNKHILSELATQPSGRSLIKSVAITLNQPYSRVLRVAKKARELGIKISASNKQNEKASQI